MSQYVGRRYDGTLELLSSKDLREFWALRYESAHTRAHFVQTYSAIYELVYTASYEGAADLTLRYQSPPPTCSNGQPIGPCFIFCLYQVPASPVLESYGQHIDNAKYGGQMWRSTLPYELLSDARVTIKLLYPIPLGLQETPILDTIVISPFDIPVAPGQQTFSPHWFTFLDIDPADASFYRPDLFSGPSFSMKDADIPSLPVTTPELAHTLTDAQWRELLGPARYYVSTHPSGHFYSEDSLGERLPDTYESHHPDTCGTCSHVITCGYCNALLARPQEWTDRNHSTAFVCTTEVLRDLILTPHHATACTSSQCRTCGRFIGQVVKRASREVSPPTTIFAVRFIPFVGGIRVSDSHT